MAFPKNQRAEKARKPKPAIPFKKADVSKLIQTHNGNVSRVADALGGSRGAMRNFIDRHSDLKTELAEARERTIDELEESCFTRAMDSNDTTLQIFLLKTQGRHRGYDQNEAVNTAKDIATAAFDFIISKDKK